MRVQTVFIIALAMVSTCQAVEVQFISVSPENTTFLDGSSIIQGKEDAGWKWLPGEGNGGVIESSAEAKRNAPPLRVTVGGLKTSADYEVFGFFWAPEFNKDDKAAKLHHWPARFGFGLASMITYGNKSMKEIPWIISSDSAVGGFLGVSSAVEETKPLGFKSDTLSTTLVETRLIRARVGVARTDKAGILAVYVDDFPDSIHCERTRIDGLAVRPAPAGSIPTAGAGDARVMHLALRARDWYSAERELATGADVNALDYRGLSALFNPVSYGDKETVSRLLSAGAKPNVPGQTIPILTVAASIGDVEIVRMLLKAGAEVPASRVEVAPWMDKSLDQSFLHPAIAAIRVGSLETLKVLLEKRPDLDLESLGPDYSPDDLRMKISKSVCQFLVEEAMIQRHDELAAFLVNRGCSLSAGRFVSGAMHSSIPRPYALLARSITEGDELKNTRDAILRRGVSVVRKLGPPYYADDSVSYGVEPWDGLSAAVSVGNIAMTRQFLLQAGELPQYYQEMLLAHARWTGEPTILSMLAERFPDAGADVTSSKPTQTVVADDEALRLLLPRIKPTEIKSDPDGNKWTLAVLAAPSAGGQGAIIEVQAANKNEWSVVDRQEVKAALEEAKFVNPWGGGKHRFSELGDRMSADLLVLVSLVESSNIKLLRFEAVDVATGLAVMREHVERDAFDPKKSVEPLLERIRNAFLKARAGNRPMAITLLPFSADDKVSNSRLMAGLLRAASQAEVDATPGLLSVGLNEIQAIANEQALAGQGEFWAAAYTLEGGVAPADKGRISLTLRLQAMKGGGGKSIDQVEEGQASELPTMVASAWKKLITSNQIGANFLQDSQPDKKQAAAEAARLLREAEWLLASGMHSEAQPILERANLLDADPELLVRLHFQSLVRDLALYRGGLKPDSHGITITHHPLNLRYQRKLFDSIGSARKLLDQMTYYQSKYGKLSLNWKRSDFWNTVELMSFIRAQIPKVLPSDISQDEIHEFYESVDQYTAEFFSVWMIKPRQEMAHPNKYGNPQTEFVTTAMLRRNPELLKGWVTMFLSVSSNKVKGRTSREGLFTQLLGEQNAVSSRVYGKSSWIIGEISKRIDEVPVAYRSLREVELAYILSTGEHRSTAARAYIIERSKQERRTWYNIAHWQSIDHLLSRYGASKLLSTGYYSPVPVHRDVMIAAVVHEPFGSMEWMSRPHYDWEIQQLLQIEEFTPAEAVRHWNVNKRPGDEFTAFAERISKSPNSQKELDDLIGAAGLMENIYGLAIHNELAAHCKRNFMPNQNGESKQGINARLLTDLRKIDQLLPGMFTMPTTDNKLPELMWLHYQPFEKNPGQDSMLRRHPWVVGVDCNSGELKTTANIAHAPGLNPGAADKNSKGGYSDYDEFLAQNDDMILTLARWPGMNYRSASVAETGVLIRKNTGELVGLSPQTEITELRDLVNGTIHAFGAVAIGDQFIAAQNAGDPNKTYRSSSDEPKQLVQISSTGAVTPVTLSGRRPQLTPFDPIDRNPNMIMPDGNRVMVIHSWDHVARYNPKDGSWQQVEGEAQKTRESATRVVTSDFHKHIFSRHKIPKNEKAPELLVKWDETLPEHLVVYKNGTGVARIKINLDIPDDFQKQPVYADYKRDNEREKDDPSRYWTYEKRKGSNAYHVVVLLQTKTDLILALQIGPGFRWLPGKHTGTYLPLLWALPIEELRNAVITQK